MPLLLAFILVPLAELWAIGQVSGSIGLGWTLLLLLGDSIAGAVLVKREGRRTWSSFRDTIQAGKWPGDEVANGALVLIGGALLLTPGFLTDGLGLFLVLPPTRAVAANVVKKRIVPVPVQVAGSVFGHRRGKEEDSVIDVEVVSVERDEPDALSDGS